MFPDRDLRRDWILCNFWIVRHWLASLDEYAVQTRKPIFLSGCSAESAVTLDQPRCRQPRSIPSCNNFGKAGSLGFGAFVVQQLRNRLLNLLGRIA